jgi:hypothetical protein
MAISIPNGYFECAEDNVETFHRVWRGAEGYEEEPGVGVRA